MIFTEYKLIRCSRKTVELSIDDNLEAVIRAPLRMSTAEIDKFAQKHEKWFFEHRKKKAELLKKREVSKDEETVLKEKALPYLTERTEYFSEIMGLKPSGIKITSAKKRFGSCSGKNGICYSWRLMQYPPEAIDYVVVHELAHIKHKNHGKEFYKLIEKHLPDYKEREKLLK